MYILTDNQIALLFKIVIFLKKRIETQQNYSELDEYKTYTSILGIIERKKYNDYERNMLNLVREKYLNSN